jgi:CHAT domain-containing protein
MNRILALIIVVAHAFFAFHSTGSAQTVADKTPSPGTPPQQEVERIEQLITECRQLMSKSSFDDMARKAEEALAVSRKIGDKVRQSRSLTYVALAAFHSGRAEEAIEPFKQAAALAREAGDKKLQLLALNSGGTLLAEVGRAEEALYFYSQALALCREQNERRAEATVLRNIGRIHITSRDYSKAQESLQSSLNLSRALSEPRLEYDALIILAQLENARANYELASSYQKKALQLESATIPASAKYQLRNDIAITHYELGNLEKSAEAQLQALDLARSQKVLAAEATALGNLAQIQLKQGKSTESLESSSQALALLRRTGADPTQQALLHYIQAQAQRALGRSEESLAGLRLAITLLERARLLFVRTESARGQFVARNSHIFTAAIDLLVSQGKQEEALAVSESYHARAFLDSLVEARADLRKVLPKELLDKEDVILSRISSVQRQLWQEGISTDREKELRQELAAAEDTLEQFQLVIRHSNPQYASLKQLQPLGADRIQGELLDSSTALVEYVIGEEKSFVWLVSKDKVSYFTLPSRNEINKLVADYVTSLAARPPGPTVKQSIASIKRQGSNLYKILLQPFERELSAFRKLIVVPDNALAYLPFETLVAHTGSEKTGNSYLVERFAITYAPSASALAAVSAIESTAVSKGFIAFGDPVYSEVDSAKDRSESRLAYYTERGVELRRLPYTRRELTSIGALFPAAERETFLGVQANEQRVKSEKLDQYRYVHFAAHGVVDEENPGRSGIILSLDVSGKEDGILQMAEIMRLKLNADLVTLSACRTGLGKLVNGEGVLGLTRAFLYAGTRSVLASLWNVNDTATAELMTAFYQNLRRDLSKDEALRRAKLQMLDGKHPAWHHPYFWASFVLIGERN